jgi:glycosyltransferase involved in cell wall biosynthesis
MKKRITNLHIYHFYNKHRSREYKETTSITKAGFVDKVTFVVFWEEGAKVYEKLDGNREVYRIKLLSQRFKRNNLSRLLMIYEFSLRVILKFWNKKFGIVNAHSAETLPLASILKLFYSSKLIYDTHELETEKRPSKLVNLYNKVFERIFIRFVDYIITVSPSIAEWYRKKYKNKKVYIVKNVPVVISDKSEGSDILKKEFNIQENELLFIYQGQFEQGRFVKPLLDIFTEIDSKKHILFMGYGRLEGKIIKYASNYKNIHFHSAVPINKILKYTRGADVGISLTENICLSFYYTIPNKFFEYILSGIPVIASDFPDIRKLIDDYEFGWKVSPEKDEVKKLIDSITREQVIEKRKKAITARSQFGWHIEEKVLLGVYNEILENKESIRK